MEMVKDLPRLFDFAETPRNGTYSNGMTGQDVISVDQFDRAKLSYIFHRSREMIEMVERQGSCDLLKGRVLACLFYEPSTRTSASFIAAMERLGGSVIPITQGVQFSSVSKGESLPDTIRTLEQYADVIVLRHPEAGAAQVAADAASVPVINAGDGTGEHPTQGLLDLFTIRQELGTIDKLKISMVGDLRYGRTVHSLTRLLMQYDVSYRFVSGDPAVADGTDERTDRQEDEGARDPRRGRCH